jgi:hypothetical protein
MQNSAELSQIFSNIHYLKNAKGEDALANETAINLRNLALDGKLNCVWFHVPNEYVIRDNIDRARVRKRHCMGMISGAPDFVFIKNDEPMTLLLELKTDKGKLSDNQKLFKSWAESNQINYTIARSWNDVKIALLEYGFVSQ